MEHPLWPRQRTAPPETSPGSGGVLVIAGTSALSYCKCGPADHHCLEPRRFIVGELLSRTTPQSGDVQSETDAGAGVSGTVTCGVSSVTTCNGFDQGTRLSAATTSAASQSYLSDASADSASLPQLYGAASQPAASYDNADELTSSTQGATTTNYAYDGDGQIASESQGASMTVTASADAAGNITAYNDTNALANTGANMSSATYNGDGVRVADTEILPEVRPLRRTSHTTRPAAAPGSSKTPTTHSSMAPTGPSSSSISPRARTAIS